MLASSVIPAVIVLLQQATGPDFGRDVRPVLAEHCFKCHGPDAAARKAGLRLDIRTGATATLASGAVPLRPGDPDRSELLRRVTSDDPSVRMPPLSERTRLSDEQVALLRRWVEDGARYTTHWSFVAPDRPALPPGSQWCRNEIDRFVLARLRRAGLEPSPEADRRTLARRVSLDLIGLPPSADELDAFVRDPRPDAYERLVDRLLRSPHYGERWARRWLDLARYADTNGYEKDRPRSMWPWRDWVIRSINDDEPFDRFTVRQLAGDLLPNATEDDLIATGFHRNTMLNEEGGIDVEEFRFAAMVDRVGTTATTWLGLTMACAQCHTHKYDPITQTEFYGLFAFFNNCDEIVHEIEDPAVAKRRAAARREIAKLERELAERFPAPEPGSWIVARPASAKSENGARLTVLDDGSVEAAGESPAKDVYVLELDVATAGLRALRVEALRARDDPGAGPGRTAHGNFVLSEVELYECVRGGQKREWRRVPFAYARADYSQPGFDAGYAIDGQQSSGWAIHGPVEGWRRDRAAWFATEEPFGRPAGGRLRVVLRQNHGGRHTLARFRVGVAHHGAATLAQRRQHLDRELARWLAGVRARASRWRTVVPAAMRSTGKADFEVLHDGSVLVYGNNPDRDTTELELATDLPRVTGIRVEALPHDSLPIGGPGRSPFFPEGGFTLTEVEVSAGGTAVSVDAASASFESGRHPAAHAIDGKPDTGWRNEGNEGRAQHIVFRFANPIAPAPGAIRLALHQHGIHNNNLGRFRISLTDAPGVEACPVPAEIEAQLARPDPLPEDARARLRRMFLLSTPLLAGARAEIDRLQRSMPRHPSALVLAERDDWRRRVTHRHHRGEFLKPREVVAAHTPAVLPPLDPDAPRDRLRLARWLVDPRHPLTARVTVNRWWGVLFGEGIVRTTEDFGTRGEPPAHPELLDWLATELVRAGWSRKALHRKIVTSATYRQSSRVTPEHRRIDPENRLLARAARLRLDAELVRDAALAASGLLHRKVGGPSVFPPQPAGVGDLSYGRLAWRTSTGPDRYRRGLYTFIKRTAPYSMFSLFGAPSGEACVPRRDRTNTPLQALTMLNDTVFVEAARALAKQAIARGGDDDGVDDVFLRCLARPPVRAEREGVLAFLARQRARFAGDAAAARQLAGTASDDAAEIAAWTALARAVLNLDEFVVRS